MSEAGFRQAGYRLLQPRHGRDSRRRRSEAARWRTTLIAWSPKRDRAAGRALGGRGSRRSPGPVSYYVTNEYDRERYSRLEQIAAEHARERLGARSRPRSSSGGRPTPDTSRRRSASSRSIHDERGRAAPDPATRLREAGAYRSATPRSARARPLGIAREVLEETGLIVVPRRLLGLYDAWLHGSTNPHHLYTVVFVCENGRRRARANLRVARLRLLRAGRPPRADLPVAPAADRGRARRLAEGWTEARFDPIS